MVTRQANANKLRQKLKKKRNNNGRLEYLKREGRQIWGETHREKGAQETMKSQHGSRIHCTIMPLPMCGFLLSLPLGLALTPTMTTHSTANSTR